MNTKYPKQICAVKRKDKVLGIDAKLYSPSDKDNVPPLEMHNGYSRFEATLIEDAGPNKITPSANIPANEVRFIKQQTDIALQQMAFYKTFWGKITNIKTAASNSTPEQETTSTGIDTKSHPAYTVLLRSNNAAIKGKTPAEILLDAPGMKEELLKMREWLSKNLDSKFRNSNQQQIDAIDDAITLLDIGELCPATAGEVTPTTVDNGMRFEIYSSPNKFKSTLKEGTTLHLVYSINIVCDLERKYPFAVNITNCYAPVTDGPNGQKIIQLSKAQDNVSASILLTSTEWYGIISRMEATLNMFESVNFFDALTEANQNSYQHS